MRLSRATVLVSATVVLLTAATAQADVAPPPEYEEECTRAFQEADDEYCESRSGGFWDERGCCDSQERAAPDGEADPAVVAECCAEVEGEGWTYRCKTYGASSFGTLWCRARLPDDPPRPERPTTEGCSAIAAPATPGLPTPIILVAMCLLVVLIIRHRSLL
jgi:hypothetical protein